VNLSKEDEIEARLAKVEEMLTALQRSVEGMASTERSPSFASQVAQRTFSSSSYAAEPPIAPRPRVGTRSESDSGLSDWFSSRSAEWWLSRLGVGFVVLAILFLYGYAVDKGWITPPIRVLAGTVVGGLLFWVGRRAERSGEAEVTPLGMRELLYGGGLALWYVTAYAASVWYQLISIPSARLVFFALGLIATWISLQERREIFAFVAIVTGFATPFILPAPLTSLSEFALYLGAVATLGLIIYLMRGWLSIVWITFIAFWFSIAGTIYTRGVVHPAALGSIPISIVLVLAAAAFVRAPSLRRQLLAIGSERYTPAPVRPGTRRFTDSFSQVLGGGKSAPDSLVLWVFALISPLIAGGLLSDIWADVPMEAWGLALFALGIAALVFARTPVRAEELRHVALTAAALWTLLGILRIAPEPERLSLSALHATAVLFYARQRFIGPRTVAKLTILLALVVVVGEELSPAHYGLLRWRWAWSELVTLAAGAAIVARLMADPAEKVQRAILAGATYLTSLVVIAGILEPIWPPLVTTSYAMFGAALLIMSRKRGGDRLMRQLGGVTMLIVVGRLLLVDLASVEAIWRVLLFLVSGAIFLYTGYRLKPSRTAEQTD
jgi:hypothetical protein